MDQVVEWLLEDNSLIQYRTRLDLLNQSENDPQVSDARQALGTDPKVVEILTELKEWPGTILKSHNDASHLIHKLAFIADLGFTIENYKDIGEIVERIFQRQSTEGPFQVIVNISQSYGGTGENQNVWMLCDAPLILYSLVKFGLKDNPQVKRAIDHLITLASDNGWPCAVEPALGKFRGPGRKTDPCPVATLLMLKLISQITELHDSEEAKVGVETLLGLWEQRKERRPYLFAMGTDFSKLKAPLIWYNILHVCDVLVLFPWVRKDERFQEMVTTIREKADERGYYTAESIWKAWSNFEFGQKRQPSRWITFLVLRILKNAKLAIRF